MAWSVLDVQNMIASEMDQSASAPSQGGADWNIRMNAMNRSLFDWANSNDWDKLKKVYNARISTSTGNASLALPTDFSKIDGYPRIVNDGSTMSEFPVVDPSKNTVYNDSDKYVNILGNDSDTNVMYIHTDALVSGASVQFTYYASPQSLASASNIIPVQDPTYLVQRSLYYLYKGREDARFPEAKVEADRILLRMIENENARGIAYVDREIPNWLEDKHSFRIGRD
jgi:hypothetical protein